MDEERLASELKGNTQRVYWCLLLSKNNVGVRQLQRKLGFSSPALAVYHLEKLVELGLVEKVHGEYRLAKIVDVGVLKQFIKVGGIIIPRHVLYASMFTTLFIFYLSQLRELNFYSVFASIFGLLATGITWFETIRALRSKP
ncbi:MAG: winged helix-turn-helix domain-containing protein [Candidatus Bathycorpusculaceae bacterium]